jgi:carboxyl-terminal processing protease
LSLILAAVVLAAGAFAKTVTPPPASAAPAPEVAPTKDEAQAAMWATRFLTRYHYKRVPLDDAMSAQILDHYVDALDGERLFFTKDDVDSFAKYRDKLDDSIYDEELNPPFAIFELYRTRVAERTAYSRNLLKDKFDFTVKESYATERSKAPWAASAKELDDLWRKRVKNDWLRLKLAGKDEAAIRDTLDKRYRNFESRVKELNGDDVFQSFLNAYAAAIEPTRITWARAPPRTSTSRCACRSRASAPCSRATTSTP